MNYLQDLSQGLRQAGRVLSPSVSEDVSRIEAVDSAQANSRWQLAANQIIKGIEAGAIPPDQGKMALEKIGFGGVEVGPSPEAQARQAALAKEQEWQRAAREAGGDPVRLIAAASEYKPEFAIQLYNQQETRAQRATDAQRAYELNLQRLEDTRDAKNRDFDWRERQGEDKDAITRERLAMTERFNQGMLQLRQEGLAIQRMSAETNRILAEARAAMGGGAGRAQTINTAEGVLERDKDGNWKPITVNGKTAMPASIAGGGTLTPEALNFVAKQYLTGDRQAVQGFARSATARVALQNAIVDEATKMGMGPEQVASKMAEFAGTVAGSRTVGQRAANISLAATEAQEMIPIVREMSDKVARTEFVPWNKALNAYESNTGTPEIAAFGASINALVNVYARAINPTGVPTVSDKEHARAVINTAQSPAQVEAVLGIINRELEIAKKAPQTVRQGISGSITGNTGRSNTGKPKAEDFFK